MILLSLGEIAVIVRGRVEGPIAVLGEMRELGADSAAEHRAVGEYAASRADNAAAVDWLRAHLAPGQVVLVKASRAARLDEVAAALA